MDQVDVDQVDVDQVDADQGDVAQGDVAESDTADSGQASSRMALQIAAPRFEEPTVLCYALDVRDANDRRLFARGSDAGPFPAAGIGGTSGPAAVSGADTELVCHEVGGLDDDSLSVEVPCAADAPETTVRVWVQSACEARANASDSCTPTPGFVNPCGTEGCALTTTCRADAETPVSFDFAALRSTGQGFFDPGYRIDDIDCAVKLENCYGDGSPVLLVVGPDGERVPTLVAAVSCLSYDDPALSFFVSDVEIDCGQRVGTLSFPAVARLPGYTEGNLPRGTLPWTSAVFRGSEDLSIGATPDVRRLYLNLAFGLDRAATCHLRWHVLPSRTALLEMNPPWRDAYVTRGVITFDAEIPSGPTCTRLGIADGLPGLSARHNPAPDGGTFIPARTFKSVLMLDSETDTVRFEDHAP